MFQDLENKAHAVSFKAGSTGKGGGAQRRTRELWEGGGRRPGLFTREMFI